MTLHMINAGAAPSATGTLFPPDSADAPRPPTATPAERFAALWEAYGYKNDKTAALKTWLRFEHEVLGEMSIAAFLTRAFPRVLHAARMEADRRPAALARGHTPMYLQGWITRRRWENEIYRSAYGHWSDAQRSLIEAHIGAFATAGEIALDGSPMSGLAWSELRAASLDAALAFMPLQHWSRAFGIVAHRRDILERLRLNVDLFELIAPRNATRLVDELSRLARERRSADAAAELPMPTTETRRTGASRQ